MSWNDGYVVDVAYVDHPYRELLPVWLSMVALFHGQPPIAHGKPLVWVELGCGNGATALTVAATNPAAQVWACDFNPAHIEHARGVAERAMLPNCVFEEASFQELASDDSIGPAEIDIIVLHGVYSWVSAQNQASIIEFVRRRLRVGGLVYVSYNVTAGWASMLTLSKAMQLKVALDPRRSDEAFEDAATMVHKLRDGGAKVFPLPHHQQSRVDNLLSIDARYGAHEYLGENFKPLMFDEVAEAFSHAKCSYVGLAEPTDHLLRLSVPRGVFELINTTADLVLRETLRDVAVMRSFRRDVYRRGLAAPSATTHEQSINDFTVVGLGKEFHGSFAQNVLGGSVTMTAELYQPVVEALESGPVSVSEVQQMNAGADMSIAHATSLLVMLIEARFAAPEVADWSHNGSRESTRRLNRVLIEENRAGASHRFLVAPATGSAVDSSIMETLVIGALWDGADPDPELLTDYVIDVVTRQRRRVLHESKHVSDQHEARLLTRQRVDATLARATGVLARLGVC